MNIYNPAPQAPDYDVLAARMDMLDGSATAPVIEAYSEIIEQALSEAPVPLNAESAEANGNYYGYLALIDRVSSLALGHTVDDLLARRRSVVPASQYGVDLPLSLLQQISAPEPSNDPTIRSWQERRQAGQEQLRRRVQEQHVDGHLPHLSTLVAQASFFDANRRGLGNNQPPVDKANARTLRHTALLLTQSVRAETSYNNNVRSFAHAQIRQRSACLDLPRRTPLSPAVLHKQEEIDADATYQQTIYRRHPQRDKWLRVATRRVATLVQANPVDLAAASLALLPEEHRQEINDTLEEFRLLQNVARYADDQATPAQLREGLLQNYACYFGHMQPAGETSSPSLQTYLSRANRPTIDGLWDRVTNHLLQATCGVEEVQTAHRPLINAIQELKGKLAQGAVLILTNHDSLANVNLEDEVEPAQPTLF